jgi:hypothetical protein
VLYDPDWYSLDTRMMDFDVKLCGLKSEKGLDAQWALKECRLIRIDEDRCCGSILVCVGDVPVAGRSI